MLTLESGQGFTGTQLPHEQRFSYMSDNLIYLSWSDEQTAQRTLRIVKMRGSAHEHEPHQFEIDASGVRVTSARSDTNESAKASARRDRQS